MKLHSIDINESVNVWFSSDFHLRHTGPQAAPFPLWKTRGYASPANMTDCIIDEINNNVKETDYLFYMGDWCLNSSNSEFQTDIGKIRCQNIYMIWGNHNSCIKQVYDESVKSFLGDKYVTDMEVYPIRYRNIVFCGDYLELKINKQLIFCCHYPIEIFDKMGKGSWMLCGHSHGNFKNTRETCLTSKRLDLSWDVFKKPLSFSEVQQIMKNKQICTLDHH